LAKKAGISLSNYSPYYISNVINCPLYGPDVQTKTGPIEKSPQVLKSNQVPGGNKKWPFFNPTWIIERPTTGISLLWVFASIYGHSGLYPKETAITS
jgi:hypothetical protein